jgi:hypothetical protein
MASSASVVNDVGSYTEVPASTSSSDSAGPILRPESPSRKTRVVRVCRNSNGVETSRSYADSVEESNGNNHEKERIPLSPIKTTIVRVHRNSNGVETSRSYEDSTDYDYNNYDEQNPKSSPTKKTVVRVRRDSNSIETNCNRTHNDTKEDSTGNININKDVPTSSTKTRLVRIRRNSLGVETSRAYVDAITEGSGTINSSADDSTSAISMNSNSDLLMSPTRTRLVRVRRNSLGLETGRTYLDQTNEELNNVGSGNDPTPAIPSSSSNDVTTSPTKTRLVRVRRDSLGMETSRTYVDAKHEDSKEVGKCSDDRTPKSPMSSPIRHQKTIASPGKVVSPYKRLSQRGRLGNKESMKKLLDMATKPTTTIETLPTTTTGPPETPDLSISQKKIAKDLPSNRLVGDDLIGGIGKTGHASFRLNTTSGTDTNPHFVGSPPNRSKSMMMFLPDVESTKEDNRIQSLRLLRVLLGEESATVSKANVDRALEKHAELLRFQLQQKKKLKQKDEAMIQEKKQQELMTESHQKETAKLEQDLLNQKALIQTSLEIKDVEIDILKKERDQKAVKVQQLSWRLAKERLAARNKVSIANDLSCHPTQASTTEQAICARCQNIDKDDSESFLDLLNLRGPSKIIDEDDISEATPVMGQSGSSGMAYSGLSPSDSSSIKHQSKSIDSTGIEVSNVVAELENKLKDTDEKLIKAKKAIVLLEKKKEEMEADFEETLHQSKAKVSQLKTVLVACNERRRVAEQTLRDLGQYDEATLMAISKKPPDELIREISDRGSSFSVGLQMKESGECHSSSVSTAELLKQQSELDVLKEELAQAKSLEMKLKRDSEDKAKQVKTALDTNTKLETLVASLKEKIKSCEVSLATSKLQYDSKIHDAATTIQQMETAYTENDRVNAAAKVELESQLVAAQEQLEISLKKCTSQQNEFKNGMDEAAQALRVSETRCAELETKLKQAKDERHLVVGDFDRHKIELDESRLLLLQSEALITEYLSRLQEASATVKHLKEKVAESSDKLEESRSVIERSEQALQKSELQVQEYAAELLRVKSALQESETMAEKYLVMLEEANATLEQSEKLMKQYDSLKPKDDSESGAGEDGSSVCDSDDGTIFSDELSSKSTEGLLAFAARRLSGIKTIDTSLGGSHKSCSYEKSHTVRREISQPLSKVPTQKIPTTDSKKRVEHDEASSVTSTHGADTEYTAPEVNMLKQWESSRQHHEYTSKIASLETELTERQLQLNDALRKIADQSRQSDMSIASSIKDFGQDTLSKALAEVSELKELVATTEAKYHEATKKLIFLKETVLTVVDANITN